MAKVPVYASAFGTSVLPSVPAYMPIGDTGSSTFPITSAIGRSTSFTLGSFTVLAIRIYTNTAVTTACTINLSIAGSAGNLAISVTAGTTGEFSDSSHIDTLTSTSTVGLVLSNGAASGNVNFSIAGAVFSSNTNTAKRIVCGGTATNVLSGTGATSYYSFGARNINNTTEANVSATTFVDATLKNFSTNNSGNTRTSATTVGTRIAGVNGALSVSITALTTGVFSDVTDSDTISSAGTLVDFYITTAGSVGSLTFSSVSTDVVTTDFTSIAMAVPNPSGTGTTVNANLTRYFSFAGCGNNSLVTAAEASMQLKAYTPFTVSMVTVNIPANTVTATSTIVLRKNTANATSSISITSGATGIFTDALDSDDFLDTGVIDYRIITGATGTAITIQSVTSKLSNLVGGNGIHLLMMMGCGI